MFDDVGGVAVDAPVQPAGPVTTPSADLAARVAALERLPAGPALATALAGIDQDALNGHLLVDVLVARSRQVASEQAQLLADVAGVVASPPGDADAPAARDGVVDEFAVDEVRMALRLTRPAADHLVWLALDLTGRLPAVWQALAAGLIDLPRARVFAEVTGVLDDTAAQAVAGQVLPAAPGLTTGQLRARLTRAVLAVDPEAAARRQRRSAAGRRLVGELDPDGTATLAGYRLPPQRAVAAYARIDAIAAAARQDGDTRTVDQLRADVLLDLLLDEHEHDPGAGPTDSPATDSPADPGAGFSDPGQDASTDTAGTFPDSAGPDSVSRRQIDPGAGRNGGVHLHITLAALAGLTDEPGHLPGWGPVLAETARAVATAQRQAPWTISVWGSGGLAAHHRLRRRPTPADAAQVRARDRTCRAPGCRTPASHADLDHTVAHTCGGPSIPANLGVLCATTTGSNTKAVGDYGSHDPESSPGPVDWATGT